MRLRDLLVPPKIRRVYDWHDVEQVLGALPHDYKELVELYGPATFDSFISVFAPNAARPALDLATQAGDQLWAMREVAAAWGLDEIPFDLDTSLKGELLPWAITVNGDLCFLVRRGATAEEWSVAVYESRGPDWFHFEGTATQFLYGVLSGDVVCPIFVPDLPTAVHSCERD